MTAKQFVLQLKQDGILTEGVKNDNTYLHLKTPCKVHLTDNATKLLRDSYESKVEKGGVLVAVPKKVGDTTHLTVDKIIFLTNVSQTPENSYLPDSDELSKALNDTYGGQTENSFPIRFHTHPTHSDNPVNELLHYLFQSNTSQQDQIVSDYPVSIGELNILMPRSLVLCSGQMSHNRMFIGFYNGLIAPIEFESHRNEQIQKAMEKVMDSITEWAKKDENKVLAIGGGILLAFLIIRFYKVSIPLILMLIAMIPFFTNDQHGQPQYFASVDKGKVTIDFP